MSRTIDDGGGSGLLNTRLRHQIVYDDSLFPVEIMRITELRMRPSAAFGSAFTATISNLQINLSTTSIEPNYLTGTFAQNVGTNDTVVFQGPLTVSSRFVGPVNGPKEFDIIIPLTTPFVYDPSRGNLLIDVRNASGSSATYVDIGQRIDDGASRVVATNVDATSSIRGDAAADVFQIVYTMHGGFAPSIIGEPQGRSVFTGGNASLSVQVLGTEPLEYQWLRGGIIIAGQTNAVLTFANVQPGDAGSYSVVVSNAFGVATSQTATLTVSESSALVVPNVSETIDGGSGSGLLNTPLRHQIVYDESLFPVEIMRITELRMRPSAALGSAFTATISNLQINLSTTSVEPNQLNGVFAQNVGTNDTVVFQGPLTVSSQFVGPANGPKEFDIIIPLMTPFLYDPSRGNLLIDFRNASGSSAGLVDIGQRNDDGASRRFATSVDATSSTGADAGAEVFQIVYTMHEGLAPLIIGEPQGRSVFAGETAGLSVVVVGTPPLKYQWLKEGTPIAVGTNAVLTLANVQLADSGNYSVVVSNAYGVVTSESATLTLSESSALVVPNVSGTIDDGGGSGLLNTRLRYQIVYDDSLFPLDLMRITELRLRPSAAFGSAFTATISNLQINLSTTSVEPNQLNRVFAQNVGSDEVMVFQGPLTVSSRFVGPANGPKEFDIIIPLATPFVYDPGRGNLLIDFRNASGSSATYVDLGRQWQDGASRVYATSVNATSSTGADSGAEVFQIVYAPESGVPPSIYAQPTNHTTFSEEAVTLTVGASGNRPLYYQWRKGSTEIIGATNSALILTNLHPSDGGSYSVVVSNAFGVAASQTATLTVSESSQLVMPTVSGTSDGGSGSGLLKIQLRHQVAYDASLFPVEIMRITELRMRPSALFGSAFTSTIPNLQINLSTTSVEPNQLKGAFAQNVGTNDTVVFQGPLTVSSQFIGPANGPKEFDIIIPLTTPFLYDPARGNLLIDFRNASGSSAGLVDIGQRTDDGASRVFATSVNATSSTGADSGAEVFQILYTLEGGSTPLIVGQPQSRNVFAGETASLSVVAVGTSPLKYQWQKGGTPITVGTNAVLTFADVQPSDAGSYSVVVSNAYGVVTSQSATLTIPESSGLVVPNVSGTIDDGGGSGLLNTRLRYQIVYDDALFPVELMRITELRMRPSAAFGSAFTATISNLRISLSTTSLEPNYLKSAFAQNVGADEAVVFHGPLTVSSRFVGPANGPKEFDIIIPLTMPFVYDPRRGNLLIDFRNASGSSAGFVDMGQRTDDGASRAYATAVDATLSTGADYGAEVFQIVYTPQSGVPPLIFAQPPSRTASLGETVTLTVGASGSSLLEYQWRKDGTAIPGTMNAALVLTNVQLSQAGNYSVVVSNAFGTVTSQPATLTVSESPPLVVPNVSRTIDEGGASGLLNTRLRYQIVYDDSLFPVELMRITELRMRPSAAFGSAFTATISNLQINLSTTSIEPNELTGVFAQNVGTNDTVVFRGSLTVSSRFVGPANGPKEFDIIIPLTPPFVYDPSRGNLLIDFRNASGSSATFVDLGLRTNDGASRVFATAVNANSSTGADYAAEVFQIVYTLETVPPSISAQPPSRSAFLGQTVTLTVGASGSPALNYQWLRNGAAILDATNATLVLTNVQLSQAGSYTVVVSNAFGAATSQAANFTVIPAAPEPDYDLSRDFSLSGNPNGVWSYGRQDTIGGPFTLLGTKKTNIANVPMILWAISFNSQPAILHNDTTQTVITDGGDGNYPPGTTWFAPGVQGQLGNYAVARLTVPAGGDGTYQLMTIARPAYIAPVQRDTDFHVTWNNRELFGVQLSGAQITGQTDTLPLVAGDTIDFAVGRGADNSHMWSQLKVEATLTRRLSNLQVSVTNVSGGGRTFALAFNGVLGNYTIEASSNLVHWVTLTNIVEAAGQVHVNDPAINSLQQRFYRARIAE